MGASNRSEFRSGTPERSSGSYRLHVPSPESLATRLLNAQVRFHLDRLTGEQLEPTVTRLAEDLFAAGGQHQIADLIEPEMVTDMVVRALVSVPSSAAASAVAEIAAEIAHDGPAEPRSIGELLERGRVEEILDALLGLTPVLERRLERLTDSPLVGTMASRFMGRIVGEVVQANQAVADKVPGLGSLVSFGTSTASRVMGAAEKQFDGLIGDTVGKGGTFAVRRLNRILIETLNDPTTREAVLQVWDLAAEEQVSGLQGHLTRDEITHLVDAGHDLVITTLAGQRAAMLSATVVDAFFERFGGYTPSELLDELDLDRDDLVADLVRLAPVVVDALKESGDLDRILRSHLEPFYTSPAVTALLDSSTTGGQS